MESSMRFEAPPKATQRTLTQLWPMRFEACALILQWN